MTRLSQFAKVSCFRSSKDRASKPLEISSPTNVQHTIPPLAYELPLEQRQLIRERAIAMAQQEAAEEWATTAGVIRKLGRNGMASCDRVYIGEVMVDEDVKSI